MIKRIITGIIVGTALMFVGRSMPKAYTLTDRYGTSFVNPISVSQDTEHLTLSNYAINVGGEQVAEVIDTTNILDVNNYTLSGYTVLNDLPQTYGDYADLYPVIAQNDASPTKFMIGNFQKPIYSDSEQTNLFFEFDTSKMPFQVKNILISCKGTPTNCTAIFSKGDLPTLSYYNNINSNRMTLNSDSMIFTWNNSRKTQYHDTYYYYSSILGYEGDIFTGYDYFYSFQSLTDNDVNKSYVSTAPITINNHNYEANYSDIQFNVNWSIIDSAHEDNSEYGSDKKVTSYSVAFEPTPWDLSEYNYYYIFVTDYNDLPPLSEWGQMTESDKGIGVLANLKEDGYVYLRITDKNNNVVHNDLFTTGNQIGKTIIFPNNNMNNQNFFNSLINDLDYGGPISSIMLIPPRFINGIYTSFGGTCSPINLSLMNKNITFNCISLNSFLGNNLVNTLDIIFSAFIGFGIFKFLYDKYDRFTNLENIDTFYNNAPKGGY